MMPLTSTVGPLVFRLPGMQASAAHCQASCENGPTVWEVVILLMVVSLQAHRGGVASAQDDVEFVAQHFRADRVFEAEARNQALARRFVRDALEDRVVVEQRVA